MELEQMPQPGPGMCGSDREVFERVWRRVMETGGGESPVEVVPAEEAALPAPAQPLPAPAVPAPVAVYPEDALCCLGPASAAYGGALQRFIEGELQDAVTYAARYLPADRAAPRLESTFLGTLRARFLAEQRGEAAYRAAAEGCQDPCLRALYLELAQEEQGHSLALRSILEEL